MGSLSRRSFLRTSALACGGVALSACSPSAPAAATPPAITAPSPAASPAPAVQPSAVAAPSLVPSPSVSSGPLTTVKAAWIAITANQMIPPLALEAGYFQKYGIDFQLSFVSGQEASTAGLAAHDLDLINAAGANTVNGRLGGQDIAMVMGFVNQTVFRVMAVGDDVHTIDDVRDKHLTIAVGLASPDYFAFQTIAQRQGWSINDFSFVQANNVTGELGLLQSGQAQVVAVSPPNDVTAEEMGAHLVLDMVAWNVPEQNVGLILEREYLAQNRNAVLNVGKACVEAIHRWKVDPDFTQQVIAKYLNSTDQRYIVGGYEAYKDVFPEQPFPTVAGMQTVIDEVRSQNAQASSLDPNSFMDNSIVQELVDSGFIAQIYAT